MFRSINRQIWILLVYSTAPIVFGGPFAKSGTKDDRNEPIASDSTCNCVCGSSKRQMRVVGGDATETNEFPWLAGLSKNGEFYCGATLITERHLLTAAHCFHGIDFRQVTIVLGDHDRNSATRFTSLIVRRVVAVKSHESFDFPTYDNDIAVVEMNEPVKFDNINNSYNSNRTLIWPACITSSSVAANDGVDYDNGTVVGVVVGWGKTSERDAMTSDLLRKVTVPLWRHDDCLHSYGGHKLTENMFCAGYKDGGRDACQGDSGGPIHLADSVTGETKHVIGVVSWGRGCGRQKLPGIYTKLSKYLDWLRQQLNGECLCNRRHNDDNRSSSFS